MILETVGVGVGIRYSHLVPTFGIPDSERTLATLRRWRKEPQSYKCIKFTLQLDYDAPAGGTV